jgi:hypothetical protein
MRRTRWVLTLVWFALCSTSCAKKPVIEAEPRRAITGPAVLAKVQGGYELRNRWQRVVIDEQSGDVAFWGPVGSDRNLLLQPGIIARLEDAPDTTIAGYVEKRDDQTWQYIGEDSDGVGWRKIYCLEEESLYVTYIVQNLRKEPRTLRIALRPNFAGMRMSQPGPDTLAGRNAFGEVSLLAFNVTRQPATQPSYLLSDEHTLKPGERISFTTEWRLSPLGG